MNKHLLLSLFALLLSSLIACTDDTGTLGGDIMPETDFVTPYSEVFPVTSRALTVDSVLANTSTCYLGSIIDPETRAKTTCDFLAQFNIFENFALPDRSLMNKDNDGNIIADSCDIRIYFDSYYGDSLTTMKLSVQELDTAKVMKENVNYYTNLDPQDFVSTTSNVKKDLTYTVKDLARSESANSGTTYYRSIVVKLPASYGAWILEKYYQHPEYFKNSYQFIHHVCPGFYFKTAGGIGSMLQNTTVSNKIPAALTDPANEYTFLKSPAGIFTEITLPIDNIIAGEHYTEEISGASISFRKFNKENPTPYDLPAPSSVVLLRKKEMFTFFEQGKLPDGANSFFASYSSSTNAYQFTNISLLIKTLKQERDAGAGVVVSDTEEQRQAKYAAWEAKEENKDWNKLVLIPVKPEYSSIASSTGTSTNVLQRVRNELGLSSAKIEGGPGGNLKLNVVYTKSNR
ncbi:MAG: DUF4270 domain-containing protein [Bacteroidales bacterium]